MIDAPVIANVAPYFQIDGTVISASRYGNGHINQTYLATYHGSSCESKFIHQRINDRIFRDVPQLMENIGRVTRHAPGIVPRLIATKDGSDVFHAEDGSWWRTYTFIDHAKSYDFVDSPRRAYHAARAFGAFLRSLANLDGGPLHETIPAFHDTSARFQSLVEAVSADPLGRVDDAATEIEFCLANEPLANSLGSLRQAGKLTECVTHNDTKVNNVMIDVRSGEGVCVIDLDTVMPGLALYDFGDMVRTATMPAAEDERDLSLIEVSVPLYAAVARGFADGAADMLAPHETDYFVTAGKVLTFECGLRFLTDHLLGDRYFRISRPGQNLDRARTQFALVRSLARREDELFTLSAAKI